MCEGNTQLLCVNLPAAVGINESEDEIGDRPVGIVIVIVTTAGAIVSAAANIMWSIIKPVSVVRAGQNSKCLQIRNCRGCGDASSGSCSNRQNG